MARLWISHFFRKPLKATVPTFCVRTVATFKFFLFLVSSLVIWSQNSWAQLNSHLLVQNESFLSPQFEATEQNQYQFIGLRIQNSLDSESMILDSEAVLAPGSPVLSYIKVKEAAFQFQNTDTQTLTLGRKKKTWSSLDDRWALGVIEPAFKWNPLNRESLGLTGLFWSVEESAFQFTAFWSPFFVPDQGPNYEINKSGEFKKVNPWFQTPPQTFRPFPESDANSTINYTVRRPPESELLLQSTLGGSAEGTISDQFLWRTAHFYKPMNQLALGYGGYYVVDSREGEVDIIPEVGYHRVSSADLVWKPGPWEFGAMVLEDDPSQVQFEGEWTTPKFEKAVIYSGYVQLNLQRQILSAEVMSIEGGKVREVGDLADVERAPITSRYPFYQAFKLRYRMRMPLKISDRLLMDSSWTHSDRNQFDLIQVRGQFEFKRRWQTYTDMQFVRAKKLTSKNHNDISAYQNNDRLMVGVAYEL